jgi:anti-sigma factor RsiW
MMKTTVSPRDVELLSAYLDGELDRRRQLKLQKRLDREPALNQLLVDLERTRSLLRSAGPIKAPRSFKLKPEMVAQPRRRPVYPVFQFASAVAVIILAVVLIGDLTGFRLGSPTAAGPAPEVAMEAPLEESSRSAEEAPQGVLPSDDEPPSELMMAAPSATATPTPTGALGSLALPEEEALDMAPLATSQILSNTVALSASESADGFAPLPEDDALDSEADGPAWLTPTRMIEIALAILAAAFAAVSIILRRKARS